MGKEWITTKEWGQLYLEIALVSFDIPILFVCLNSEKKRFLCLNVGENNDKYVICEVNNNQLLDMLTNSLPMEDVFRSCIRNRILIAEYDYDTEEIKTNLINSFEISGDLLPKKGAYFELSNKKIMDYIDLLRSQSVKVEVEQCFDTKICVVPLCENHSYFSTHEKNKVIFKMGLSLCQEEYGCYVVKNERMIA